MFSFDSMIHAALRPVVTECCKFLFTPSRELHIMGLDRDHDLLVEPYTGVIALADIGVTLEFKGGACVNAIAALERRPWKRMLPKKRKKRK